jgi:hypothetical protein
MLVVSDYFAAIQARPSERANYDAYVRNSRSIAVRIACEGLENAQAAAILMRDCQDGFDAYVGWLENQVPSNASFWMGVQRRLNIDRAAAPLLSLEVLLRQDMDGLSELLGCAFRLHVDEKLLSESGFELSPGLHFSQYVVCKREGFTLLLEDSVVSAVWLHTENSHGYKTFPRRLSDGLAFGDRRSAIRRALGRPTSVKGMEYRYHLDDYRLIFTFRAWAGTLSSVGMYS